MAYDDYDYSGIEAQLRQRAQQKGLQYSDSDLQDIKSNTQNLGATLTPEQALEQIGFRKYDERATNTPGGGQPAPQYQTPTQAWNNQPSAPAASSGGRDQLMQLLMQRAQQGTAVDRNDPMVRQQVDPIVAQQERTSRNYLDDVAERSGPLANIQGERRLAAERGGQAAGALESEVIGRQAAQRAQEIEQALSLWGHMLSEQDQLALAKELAYLQDASRSADRAQNASFFSQSQSQANDQFMRELALREYDTNNTWDYRWSTLGA